jgi:hypothetical protein
LQSGDDDPSGAWPARNAGDLWTPVGPRDVRLNDGSAGLCGRSGTPRLFLSGIPTALNEMSTRPALGNHVVEMLTYGSFVERVDLCRFSFSPAALTSSATDSTFLRLSAVRIPLRLRGQRRVRQHPRTPTSSFVNRCNLVL